MLSWESKLSGIDPTQERFPNCFGCGRDNPVGLQLRFVKNGEEASSHFTISDHYQGWYGFVHGGIIATILDEAMAYTFFPETKGVTARAEIRFKHPAPVGVPMVVTARLVKRTRKVLTTTARIALEDGTVVAESTAQSYVVRTDRERPEG